MLLRSTVSGHMSTTTSVPRYGPGLSAEQFIAYLVEYSYARGSVPKRPLSSSPEPPTDPNRRLVDCPACLDEKGEPTGEILAQLPSGTWVREKCGLCAGFKQVDDTALALYLAQSVDE